MNPPEKPEARPIPEIPTDQDARYAIELVKAICAQVGPGLPGSPQERQRAGMVQKELETHLGAGNVAVEEFSVAPEAFLSAYPISALLTLAAALLNSSFGRFAGIAPWAAEAALALSILSMILVTVEFMLGFELVDRFFPKKPSVNVIGALRRPGTQAVKRLLILSGHHDSALENTWLRLLGYGFFFASTTWLLGLIAMLAMSLLQVAGLIADSAGLVRLGTLGGGPLGWGLLVFPIVPSVIFGLFFTRGRKNGGIVPGAVDNLAASALAVALCRFLAQNPAAIPPDTEIRFISFGSEEAGLRGSRRYVERHRDELKRLDARLLNFEMIAYPEISILTSDMNGRVMNSPEMVSSVVAAAERAEIPFKVTPASMGVGTDAAPFTRAGLKALTLLPFQMPQQLVAFYHQQGDTPDNLTIAPLCNGLKLAFEWVRCGGEGAE
jgi:hypothetical protein